MKELTKTQIHALRKRWEILERDGCGWGSLEEFAQWSVAHGFQTTKELYKLDTGKPHAPDNSFWYYQNKELPNVLSPVCVGCTEIMPVCNTIGCYRYREYFVKNWNENIHRELKRPETKKQTDPRCFRYEHPDLEREGIVFEPNQHIR